MNPKRKAYRNPSHPLHSHYMQHVSEMTARKNKRSTARATVRYYRIAGESGGNRYLMKNGSVLDFRDRAGVIGTVQQALRGMLPKTGIQRQQ